MPCGGVRSSGQSEHRARAAHPPQRSQTGPALTPRPQVPGPAPVLSAGARPGSAAVGMARSAQTCWSPWGLGPGWRRWNSAEGEGGVGGGEGCQGSRSRVRGEGLGLILPKLRGRGERLELIYTEVTVGMEFRGRGKRMTLTYL